MTEANFIKPRVRLFLSVDIVGSTAYKQKNTEQQFDGKIQKWLFPIATFYHKFEENFFAHWDNLKEKADNPNSGVSICFGPEPTLWKMLGDELIYTKIITNPIQIEYLFQAWRQTLREYRKIIRFSNEDGDEKDNGLDLKSCAWIAGFPYENAEVALAKRPQKTTQDDTDFGTQYTKKNFSLLKEYYSNSLKTPPQSSDVVLDFLGPSMDTGFRLGKFCSPLKTVISVDLAYTLLVLEKGKKSAKPVLGDKHISASVHYMGRKILKGVATNEPYPIFWLNEYNESYTTPIDKINNWFRDLEDQGKNPPGLNDIKFYLETTLGTPNVPYFCNENLEHDPDFAQIPPHHKEKIGHYRDTYKKLDLQNEVIIQNLEDQNKSGSELNQQQTDKILAKAPAPSSKGA